MWPLHRSPRLQHMLPDVLLPLARWRWRADRIAGRTPQLLTALFLRSALACACIAAYPCAPVPFPAHDDVSQVGCGAGNTVFPVVLNTTERVFVYACDYAPSAVEVVRV